MSTFLTLGPQPGDGSWLLQQNNAEPARSQRGGSRRRTRRRQPQEETFLTRTDSVVGDNGDGLPSQSEKNMKVTHASFLQMSRQGRQTSSSTAVHMQSPQPRPFTVTTTITTPKPLSSQAAAEAETPVVNSGPSTLSYTSFIEKLPPTPPPKEAFAVNNNIESDARSTSSIMTTKNVIPPHRRVRPTPLPAKVESVTEDIGPKLSSLGVSAGDPKPAPKQNDGGRNGEATQQRVPPGSPNSDKPVYRGRGGARGNTRGRGGGGGWHTAPKQRNVRDNGWVAHKTIPKGDPTRWETDWAGERQDLNQGWAGESDKGKSDSFDSAQADGGRGGGKKRAQNEAGYELGDWQGNWAPAPCDWDCRPAFRANQNEGQIWQWIAKTEQWLNLEPRQPSLDELSTVDGVTYLFGSPGNDPGDVVYEQMGAIVPRYWMPVFYGREAPQNFWHEIVKSTQPPPEDEGDLDGVRPWWEQVVPGGTFLANYTHPRIDGIDPDESAEEKMKREADRGANQHAENRKRFELAKREGRLARQKCKDEKTRKLMAVKAANQGESPEQLQSISTNVKVFIRHAKPEDMPQLRDLYNYYVDFTCAAPETERVSSADMSKRRNDVLSRKLPFLVACEPGGVLKGRGKRNMGEDIILPDKIIGFALADDHTGPRGNMFRYTVEAEVYIHKDFLMKGVAKCLMDKLMAMLDPEYLERSGYDVRDEDLEVGVARPSRVIQSVLMYFKHESSKTAKLEWVNKWLREFMGFESVGYLEHIGTKLGFQVNQAIFQRQTGVTIDVANPPDVLKTPTKIF